MKTALTLPTVELVEAACKKFDREESVIEDALKELFRQYPGNDDLSHVLLKVVALNALYSTLITIHSEERPNVVDVARHIHKNARKIDSALAVGSPEIVGTISWVTVPGKQKRDNFSFISSTQLEPWTPTVDIQQCNGDLVVTVELPGLKKEDVKVELTDDSLVIQGERKHEHKEDHEGFHRWERSYGQFYRSIPLPEGAKTDQAKAELTDGVLKVSVPVPETKKKPRQIPVEQGKETKPAAA